MATNVTTYHNDAKRTGWNPEEILLSPATVNASSFGLLATVALDDKVDAQPLVVAEQTIEGRGLHSVLYVATESNTVYAIDALSGEILKKRSLGATFTPDTSCAKGVSVASTPTIDLAAGALYILAGTRTTLGAAAYHLHALDLETLKDIEGSPVLVKASQTLEDGSKFQFNAAYQRQRPALLESQGRIYIGFGGFGDCFADKSRGWVLGWDKRSLAPLSANELTNRRALDVQNPSFLSELWMSGYGLAADTIGDVYFVTGNSASGSFDETANLAESAVRLTVNLNAMVSSFTPANVNHLDDVDGDFGSGGLMVLPDQSGPFPHLAVAGGKDGRLFVLNRDNMGGHHSTDIPNYVSIGGCWCGPSYFELSKEPVVVSSGGTNLSEWTIATANNLPTLSLLASTPAAVETTQHDPGFFTSISSDGSKAGTAIIWAVGHGAGRDNSITLHAFDATPANGALRSLWSGVAGVWPTDGPNPNVVPTVANGRVYVASVKQVRIFGLLPKTSAGAAAQNEGNAVLQTASSR